MAGTGLAGTGLAGTGLAGTGLAGTGLAGNPAGLALLLVVDAQRGCLFDSHERLGIQHFLMRAAGILFVSTLFVGTQTDWFGRLGDRR